METLFALVLTIAMTNGDYQDVVLGVYDNRMACETAATEQQVIAECFEVDRIIPGSEQPAGL